MVRISNRVMVQSALDRTTASMIRVDKARDRISSGRDVNRPSDDPSSASRILSLQTELRTRDQEVRNANDGQALTELADSALQTVVARLQRARDLMVAGASAQYQGTRPGMAVEIQGIRDEVISVAGTSHDGRTLFTGFAEGEAVRYNDGTDANPIGWVTDSDGGAQLRRVGPSDVVTVNVTANELFGLDNTANGTDLFTLLDDIAAAMNNEDPAAIGAHLSDIDAALESIYSAQAKLGTAGNRIEQAQRRNIDTQVAIRSELSQIQDTDMADAIMELQMQEMSYEATLSALGRSLPQSLVAFLR